MNTKDFLRLGVPLGQATRRATDFTSYSSSAAARPGARLCPAERDQPPQFRKGWPVEIYLKPADS